MSQQSPRIVFLHGVGGARGGGWLKRLNARLEMAGYATIDKSDVMRPDYGGLLKKGADRQRTKLVVVNSSGDRIKASKMLHDHRIARIRRLTRPYVAKKRRDVIRVTPRTVRRRLARSGRRASRGAEHLHSKYGRHSKGLEKRLRWPASFAEAERYRRKPTARAAVLAKVLAELPDEPFVLVAHSLGSQVAADLLQYLPSPSPVVMLVTIGTPLSSDGIMGRTKRKLQPFPYDKVGCWVNIYSHRDWVSSGRPLGKMVPGPILDLPIRTRSSRLPGEHGRKFYFRHKVTAAVIAEGLLWVDEERSSRSRIM